MGRIGVIFIYEDVVMVKIPLIVGFGGINAAGRSSNHQAYKRIVFDQISEQDQNSTLQSLRNLMGNGAEDNSLDKSYILENTLIRKISKAHFDVDAVEYNQRVPCEIDSQEFSLITKPRNVPQVLNDSTEAAALSDGSIRLSFNGKQEFLVPSFKKSLVKAAGQLPEGFNPGDLYQSRSHPRALQMSVFAASDAINSMGIDWSLIENHVSPDKISVYAGSAMSQLDEFGNGGMLSARLGGGRCTSKNLALGLPEMPADFVNAYVLGAMGNTGANTGACASFLYNLRQAVADIQSGDCRVAVVGAAEAAITPDVIEGYVAMGALATDKALLELDKHKNLSEADYRRAARPFSTNCGFTIGESAQFVVLFDDELAVELGATVYGAVPHVYVNADGHKKSISSPGVGNYVTMAKAFAATKAILGQDSLSYKTFVHAHGTSTPQNRVSESHILNELAKTFNVPRLPVAAIKAYLGHSIAASAGDQLSNTLGVWQYGILPGIKTIDHVADDVFSSNLKISAEHLVTGNEGMDAALLNSKGFGGNNASAVVLAPHVMSNILKNKYGEKVFAQYLEKNQQVQEKAAAYDEQMNHQAITPTYKFDHNVLAGEDLAISDSAIKVLGHEQAIDLPQYSGLAQWLNK